MLKRKVYDDLKKWKESREKKCLILSGARQVGKTYIIREFAKENYSSFIELNFLEAPDLKKIFDSDLSVNTIMMGIRLNFADAEIVPGSTLIFLDEIQECPNAVTALKFLSKSEDIDVIASGSALGMIYNRVTSYPVGSVENVDMFPLDFREFLWALGINDGLIEELKGFFERLEPVPIAVHDKMMHYLKMYMAIGGMPEVVDTFVNKNYDYNAADHIQRQIYRDYLADIARYAEPDIKIKAEKCYRSIPSQLNKENHKFQYMKVEKNGTSRKFETSLDWLISAQMAYPVMNVSYIEYPLKAFELENNLRIYPSDIGLLVGTYEYSLKRALIADDMDSQPDDFVLKTSKGGLYEALVADMFIKKGYTDLHFIRNESGTLEMEFLLEGPKGVFPVEVKAGRSGTKSLNNILKKEDIAFGYKLSSQNIGKAGKKITLPLYMAIFI